MKKLLFSKNGIILNKIKTNQYIFSLILVNSNQIIFSIEIKIYFDLSPKLGLFKSHSVADSWTIFWLYSKID